MVLLTPVKLIVLIDVLFSTFMTLEMPVTSRVFILLDDLILIVLDVPIILRLNKSVSVSVFVEPTLEIITSLIVLAVSVFELLEVPEPPQAVKKREAIIIKNILCIFIVRIKIKFIAYYFIVRKGTTLPDFRPSFNACL